MIVRDTPLLSRGRSRGVYPSVELAQHPSLRIDRQGDAECSDELVELAASVVLVAQSSEGDEGEPTQDQRDVGHDQQGPEDLVQQPAREEFGVLSRHLDADRALVAVQDDGDADAVGGVQQVERRHVELDDHDDVDRESCEVSPCGALPVLLHTGEQLLDIEERFQRIVHDVSLHGSGSLDYIFITSKC